MWVRVSDGRRLYSAEFLPNDHREGAPHFNGIIS